MTPLLILTLATAYLIVVLGVLSLCRMAANADAALEMALRAEREGS